MRVFTLVILAVTTGVAYARPSIMLRDSSGCPSEDLAGHALTKSSSASAEESGECIYGNLLCAYDGLTGDLASVSSECPPSLIDGDLGLGVKTTTTGAPDSTETDFVTETDVETETDIRTTGFPSSTNPTSSSANPTPSATHTSTNPSFSSANPSFSSPNPSFSSSNPSFSSPNPTPHVTHAKLPVASSAPHLPLSTILGIVLGALAWLIGLCTGIYLLRRRFQQRATPPALWYPLDSEAEIANKGSPVVSSKLAREAARLGPAANELPQAASRTRPASSADSEERFQSRLMQFLRTQMDPPNRPGLEERSEAPPKYPDLEAQ